MNSIGSYTCDCETGFELLGDQFSCQGQVVIYLLILQQKFTRI